MTKYKLFTDFEKEEAWLDKMADSGWRLEKVTPSIGRYVFTRVEEGAYCPKVRIDFRIVPKKEAYEYIKLFEESGWENICASNKNGRHYFRQISDNSDDSIFSDSSSAIGRYKRMGNVLALLGTVLFIVCIFNLTVVIDAARQSEGVFVIICSVIFGFALVVGLMCFVIGYDLLKKYKQKSENQTGLIEDDRAVRGDRTTRFFLRRMILLPIAGGVAGFAIGSLVSLLQNR